MRGRGIIDSEKSAGLAFCQGFDGSDELVSDTGLSRITSWCKAFRRVRSLRSLDPEEAEVPASLHLRLREHASRGEADKSRRKRVP
jgi:hypothetical protein